MLVRESGMCVYDVVYVCITCMICSVHVWCVIDTVSILCALLCVCMVWGDLLRTSSTIDPF